MDLMTLAFTTAAEWRRTMGKPRRITTPVMGRSGRCAIPDGTSHRTTICPTAAGFSSSSWKDGTWDEFPNDDGNGWRMGSQFPGEPLGNMTYNRTGHGKVSR